MKNINEYILEGNANKAMFDACMELENNDKIYPQARALSKAVEKKIKSNDFDFDHLANSSSIDKLITACIKSTKERVDSESRKELRKYFAACILKLCSNDIDLPKDIEDLYIEWDFYDGPKKIDF